MYTINQVSHFEIDRQEQEETDISLSANTPNATLFYSSEAPLGYRLAGRRESYRDWFDRLWGYQTGLYNGWWGDAKKLNNLDKIHRLDSIMGQLELTVGQRSQARYFLTTKITDMRKFKVSNIHSTETTLLALCAYVCWKDGRNCHPNHDKFDDLFEELKIAIGIRYCDYIKAYGKVESKILRNDFESYNERDQPAPPLEAGHWWPSKKGI